METKVGVDRLDVECDDCLFAMGKSKGKSDVGAEGVSEDVGEQSEGGSEGVKGEKEYEIEDHTIFSICSTSSLVALDILLCSFLSRGEASGPFSVDPPG